MSEQVGITINKEHEITYTSKECSYIISKRDWDRLSRTINRLKHSSNKWANIAWGALSACVSFICSWLTCRDYMVLLVLGVVALAIAICSFFTASIDKKHYIASVDQLKEVIKEIEDEIIT